VFLNAQTRWLNMLKRWFDISISATLLLLLAPLGLLLAAAIKLDSPGPVFFRQERVGRYGKTFRIHKFRTMVVDAASHGPAITVGQDARITRLGAWLRRSKLDELAQLIDVLRGDMSLVGPRPEVPKYVALYPPELRERVLSVRPGITDPVSLAHADESDELARATDPERYYVDVVMPRKLRAAAAYAQHATLFTDLGVLWHSVVLLLKRRA
jgi:lipopolysaccharide/colanic/teichoic acid biosynthesis glycosyltransferase